ncbi:MAG TPA: 3-hydroxyacyl-CoA dehydrogenase NAD-binding domain-containing protein [Candidatus Baltobacteraceae bacterium]|jgi:3-hydroxyacyl-CoA dehydrogenase|nr:3-hydroxyacyl-CoA dehydrogenase NAD-binding domain-containing protein [Candidatus Baltobacteraceae bacterium]
MVDTRTRKNLLRTETRENVRILILDNPPVNAISSALSATLIAALAEAESDTTVSRIVITGANGTFSGGFDINEFLSPPPADAKNLRHVIAAIEHGEKTTVAAIDGNALGGGFELALACDYRIAAPRATLGLPEIKLGLIPGAGGTQRLPRLIGPQPALDVMLKGEMLNAERAKSLGILDEIAADDLHGVAAEYAGRPRRRTSARSIAAVPPFLVAMAHKMVPPEEKGGLAAHTLIDAVEAATSLPFEQGLAREFRLFDELIRSEPARALIHLFFAERELDKIPGVASTSARVVNRVAVVGAGLMGTGIALSFANADIPVLLYEASPKSIETSKKTIEQTFFGQVAKGRLSEAQARERAGRITFVERLDDIADVDLVVEAVFENLELKQRIFADLDRIVRPDAILASNTSTLDVDAIGSLTKRQDKVIGAHFFSPANIMKLLEVVRGAHSSPETIITAMKLAKRLRKVGVLSGNAFGFIGNAMFEAYAREAILLLEEGALPHQVDHALEAFGFAMGPLRVIDLAGVDLTWHVHQSHPPTNGRLSQIEARLVNVKRLGQKNGKGFYRYESGSREAQIDPEVEAIIREESRRLDIDRRKIDDQEIIDRCVFALINVGARLLEEGIALRPGDIDVVWIYGYGFPPHRGGPMWYADRLGLGTVLARMREFEKRFGMTWKPAPLLLSSANAGTRLADFPKN